MVLDASVKIWMVSGPKFPFINFKFLIIARIMFWLWGSCHIHFEARDLFLHSTVWSFYSKFIITNLCLKIHKAMQKESDHPVQIKYGKSMVYFSIGPKQLNWATWILNLFSRLGDRIERIPLTLGDLWWQNHITTVLVLWVTKWETCKMKVLQKGRHFKWLAIFVS